MIYIGCFATGMLAGMLFVLASITAHPVLGPLVDRLVHQVSAGDSNG